MVCCAWQVTGDTVLNMDLRGAVAAHRARREKDKLAIMTMVSELVWGRLQGLRTWQQSITGSPLRMSSDAIIKMRLMRDQRPALL